MKIKRVTRLCLLISTLGGILGAIFRTVALLNNYDPVGGHFTIGDPQPAVGLGWTLPVICLLAVCLICVLKRGLFREIGISHGLVYTVGAFITSIGVLTVFFESVSSAMGKHPVSKGLDVVIGVFAVLSCAVILSGALIPAKGVNLVRAGIAVVPALFIVLPGFKAYFDPDLVMNCPNKNVYIIAACCVALSVITECRFNTDAPKPMLFVILCCATVSFGLLCGVPNVIYLAINKAPLLSGWAADVAILGFAVFSALRLLSVRSSFKRSKKAEQ